MNAASEIVEACSHALMAVVVKEQWLKEEDGEQAGTLWLSWRWFNLHWKAPCMTDSQKAASLLMAKWEFLFSFIEWWAFASWWPTNVDLEVNNTNFTKLDLTLLLVGVLNNNKNRHETHEFVRSVSLFLLQHNTAKTLVTLKYRQNNLPKATVCFTWQTFHFLHKHTAEGKKITHLKWQQGL